MSPHAAGRAARLQLGGVDQVTEQVRDVRVSRSSPAVAGDRCYADESRALDGVTQLARVGAGVRCLAPQRSGYIRRDRVEAAADGHAATDPHVAGGDAPGLRAGRLWAGSRTRADQD